MILTFMIMMITLFWWVNNTFDDDDDDDDDGDEKVDDYEDYDFGKDILIFQLFFKINDKILKK